MQKENCQILSIISGDAHSMSSEELASLPLQVGDLLSSTPTHLSTYSPSSHLLSSSPSHLATYSPTLEIKKILSSRGRTKQPTTCPTSLARSSSSPSSSSTKTTSLLSLMLTGPSPGKLKKVENNLNRNLQRRCLGVRPPLSSWNHPSSGILLIWRGWCW